MRIFLPFLISIPLLLISCASTRTVHFRDAGGGKHKFEPNMNAALHGYDVSRFRMVDSRISYDDPRYAVRHGLDISRHDGKIDWKKVKEQGYDFIILRCAWRGYQTGILHEDENFRENIAGARNAGLDVGVYVFSQAVDDAEALEEAEFVLDVISGYEINLPVVYDPESIPWDEARTDGIGGEQFTRNVILFCEKVRGAGYEPMVYANHMWEAFVLDMETLKDYKFWYADYEEKPQLPYDFEFWQYTAFQQVDGIEKKCDADVWIQKID